MLLGGRSFNFRLTTTGYRGKHGKGGKVDYALGGILVKTHYNGPDDMTNGRVVCDWWR